jgi:bifunctional non-homologous end joining protein LigD
MALQDYRKKRNFKATPEPPGRRISRKGNSSPIFVVQKHSASHLHYDFRLEIDGVLVSWAIPKGPSMSTRDRRLAMPTEDHPLEYADFEGTIPEGHYGAGTVMVWDKGVYEIEGDNSASEQLDRGELKFRLAGEKLQGGFVLIRSGERWFLIKRRDASVKPSWNIDRYNRSALSGRTLEEIAGLAARPRRRQAGGERGSNGKRQTGSSASYQTVA